MRIDGKKLIRENILYGPEVIQRGVDPKTRKPILYGFYAQPVWNYDEFYELCPAPEPSDSEVTFGQSGKKQPDYKNPGYLQRVEHHEKQRYGYYILKSLEPSKIDIDGMSLEDVNTWHKVPEAMRDELTHYEFGRVMTLLDEANSVDRRKLEVNRETFLSQSSESQKDTTTTNTDEATST